MKKTLAKLSFISILSLFSASASAIPNVWINEIHYDNTGGDVGEFVEIAGPSGTDLSGYSVVFYNGTGGASYDTLGLAGVLPDQQNGFGVLSFNRAGIQNGSPDGLALFDPLNFVIQFLSYEGSFTAIGGPADGLTSTDIGVLETSSSPVGSSLQLVGIGNDYIDFGWSVPSVESPGLVNSGQEFVALGVPDATSSAFLFSLSLLGLFNFRRGSK